MRAGEHRAHEVATRGFSRSADAYERGRPEYPPEAVAWLRDALGLGPGRVVVDVGAGTGKLTRALVTTGARVVAVEPVAEMRAILTAEVPQASALEGLAEALPLADGSVDAVVAAAAFHWFDAPAALADFHRVLRPSGRLALVWNKRRRTDPLQQAISAIVEPHRADAPSHRDARWRDTLASSGRFGEAGRFETAFDQALAPEDVVERAASISFIAALDDGAREAVLAEVSDLAAAQPQPVAFGYVTEAFVFDRV